MSCLSSSHTHRYAKEVWRLLDPGGSLIPLDAETGQALDARIVNVDVKNDKYKDVLHTLGIGPPHTKKAGKGAGRKRKVAGQDSADEDDGQGVGGEGACLV